MSSNLSFSFLENQCLYIPLHYQLLQLSTAISLVDAAPGALHLLYGPFHLQSETLSPTSTPFRQGFQKTQFAVLGLLLIHVCEESASTSQGSLLYSRAFWVSESIIAWNVHVGNGSCYLLASKTAALSLTSDGILGEDVKVKLEEDKHGLPENVREKFPHIKDYRAFNVPPDLDAKPLLKCQLAVATFNSDGRCSDATGLQLPGILDDLFSYNGPLGALYSKQSVSLTFGRLRLSTLRIEKCYANDPYARGLSSDGRRTLLVNLDSDNIKPEGWDKLVDEKPDILSFSDISIYELHIRDFSASDQAVHPEFRGGYLAFTLQDSAGAIHLKKLSNAGITHVHLLPAFQFAGVDDEKENWKSVDPEVLEKFPSDSDEQQALITAIQNDDGYNWGYNPVLWGVPKGSYASNANGCIGCWLRSLNRFGLRVVLDVVYNHLHGSGPIDDNSVLDKIVPGYYLRRNADGFIEHSTCVNNTASEHFMVERLIVDDLLHWAVDYKVDGFRFDLMGHIMRRTMVKAKDALCSLTKERDGVDGSSIYIYGEGWDFGEVANNGRGINASQFNIHGTGIGSFNDRIRDAILGGSPFGHPLQQGFVTGLLLQNMLAESKDHIQVGMAANLRDFVLTNCEGKEVKGSEVLTYGGTPVAYTLCPTETINYVSAHDNETLFDIVSLKTPMEISVEERCRINHLATSIVALAQGIPFFHSGDEILRSKSLDRDSYNSGDWFNRLDFTYSSNNWGVGLPPKEKNEKSWPLFKPRLADPSFKPQRSHIIAAVENFSNLLRIRYSSPLFRLRTANAIQERVRFHNTGPSLVPGVIVMSIEDGHEGVPGLSQLDPIYSYIVVIVNACPTEVSFASPSLQARTLQLHPEQVMSNDEIVTRSTYNASAGCFTVPPRTTSVFVEPRGV
ncbi:pullulanase 1 chloroplastic [Prunus yedoensis var. nudiflora]|uniref:Pullulanase 1 chloroplastic n=1 Tax=Prunus yedoensis var. nudiflora TaxID=2094558 RepID=A0A314YPH9_PRUYE|nr:pullulanase 1 chloroplastic [Prunus yedoensis var. nudiflora]